MSDNDKRQGDVGSGVEVASKATFLAVIIGTWLLSNPVTYYMAGTGLEVSGAPYWLAVFSPSAFVTALVAWLGISQLERAEAFE